MKEALICSVILALLFLLLTNDHEREARKERHLAEAKTLEYRCARAKVYNNITTHLERDIIRWNIQAEVLGLDKELTCEM